jgi:hypothetical protein
MGAQFSKTAAKGEAAAERPGEAAVASSPSKANGQVNSTCGFRHFFGVFLESRRFPFLLIAPETHSVARTMAGF